MAMFHHEHTHGRVFNGLEARQMLEMEKRDSHGSTIKLNVPENFELAWEKPDNKMAFIHNRPGVAHKNAVEVTVVSDVYVTAPQTFSGSAQYVTESSTDSTPTTAVTDSAAGLSNLAAQQSSYAHAKSLANNPQQNTATSSATTSLQTTPPRFTRESASSSSLQTNPPRFTRSSSAATTSSATLGVAAVGGTPIQTTRAPSVVGGTPLSATNSNNAEISQKSDGMSGGAKAGLAFGIIIAIALAAGLVFFCWRRRKNQHDNDGREKLDEKHTDSFFGGNQRAPSPDHRGSIPASLRSTRTASTAPRLSLRPVTQFLPYLMENRRSKGNALDVPAMSEKPKSAWERRPQGTEQNPFDDAAVLSEKQANLDSPPANPFDEGDGEKQPISHSQKSSWEGSDPPTPKSTKFGTASAVAVTSAGAPVPPAQRGPNNVHRVQLDFKPSMEDELELISGQIVRMLHEYDDGWALCIRMDRSQQGVCPRTCLSKLPVKPRPQGPPPPNGPHGRPMGPPGAGMLRSQSPGMPRPQSPQVNGMVPRPLTPNGQNRERSQTMGRASPASSQHGRNRSQSMGAGSEGMPVRKPVPGMAL